jgi:signal transduction histidine kinase
MDFRIKNLDAKVSELFVLTGSFNDMADRLRDREKSYLDLIGFVAHELKAILASTIMNAYTVRDGYLGMVNFKQRKALDSVARNLDYFSATVKNFLELSRIEKRELNIHKTEFLLKEEIFDMAVDLFLKQAEGKHKAIKNLVPAGIKIEADRDLLQVAANNLIGNAVKYGSENGEIIISLLEVGGGAIRVEVYNDGDVIPEAEKDRLFKKFSRLDMPQARRASGTGLGLFITREIIEKHGGKIWVEAREKGNAFIFEINKEG